MEGVPRHPMEDRDRTTVEYAAGASHPAQIGPYRILTLIGEGAMGIVYEAEQERPHRRVALKIIRPGIATPSMLRRFEHEYEFLGRLQHPGIAQIYEAGVAESAYGPQPYFAMELVRGRRLDEYLRVRAARRSRSSGPRRGHRRRRPARPSSRRDPPRPQARKHPGRPRQASRRCSTSGWRARRAPSCSRRCTRWPAKWSGR